MTLLTGGVPMGPREAIERLQKMGDRPKAFGYAGEECFISVDIGVANFQVRAANYEAAFDELDAALGSGKK